MSAPNDRMTAALAGAVLAVGEDQFGDAILRAVNTLAEVDLCSAFRVQSSEAPQHLCSAGNLPQIPRFAEVASSNYASVYWRRDALALMMQNLASGGDEVHVFRQAWNDIRDSEYRRACYERASIVERITMLRSGPSSVCLSVYRTEATGPSSALDCERLEACAPILTAAVAKHASIRSLYTRSAASESAILIALLQREEGLSSREAEIAAALAVGRTQAEIAKDTGLTLNSVITYRKRAYGKLGISDRHALQRWVRSMRDCH